MNALTATDAESNPITFSYQWQRSTDDKTWINENGATNSTLSPLPGYFWRARIRPSDAGADGVWFTTESIMVDVAPVLTATDGHPYSYTSKLVVPAPLPLTRVPVIINEISKGTSGFKRWVELLTQQNVDLRDYRLRTSYGGAEVEFADVPFWQSVPAGTLIVIYYGADRDPALPPNDADPSDGTLVLSDSNTAFFSSTSKYCWIDTYVGNGNSSANYQGRGYRLRKGANSDVFGLEWGGSSGTGVHVPTFQQSFTSGQSLRYIGGAPDSAEISSSWEFAAATAAAVSPGRSNSVTNEDYVQRLRTLSSPPRFRLVTPVPPGLSFSTTTGTLSGTVNAPAGGIFPVTIERYHPYASELRSYQLTVSPAPGSLEIFRANNGLAADGSQDLLAPAGDGVPNLLKYGFNMLGSGPGQVASLTTPNSSVLAPTGTAGLPFARLEVGTGNLQITYIRRKADATPASGITYAVEFSDALGSWAENRSATESGVGIDDTFERVTVTDVPGIPGKRFARVRITNN